MSDPVYMDDGAEISNAQIIGAVVIIIVIIVAVMFIYRSFGAPLEQPSQDLIDAPQPTRSL